MGYPWSFLCYHDNKSEKVDILFIFLICCYGNTKTATVTPTFLHKILMCTTPAILLCNFINFWIQENFFFTTFIEPLQWKPQFFPIYCHGNSKTARVTPTFLHRIFMCIMPAILLCNFINFWIQENFFYVTFLLNPLKNITFFVNYCHDNGL